MSLRRKCQQNLLLGSVKLNSKHQFSSYYSRNKQKLPPILQSKNIFFQHLINHQKHTNQIPQPCKPKSMERTAQKNNICLKRKPQTYRSIQHISNFNKSLISIQPKQKIKHQDECQEQKKIKARKNIYLSATKLNLQIACRSPKAYSKEKANQNNNQKRLTTNRFSLQNRLQLQKLALSTKIGFLAQDYSQNNPSETKRVSFLKKDEGLIRKHLRTCMYDQQQKISVTSRKFLTEFFEKKEKHEFGNKSVTEMIFSQTKITSNQLSSLDQKLQTYLLDEKVEPWSYNSPPQMEMIGNFMNT